MKTAVEKAARGKMWATLGVPSAQFKVPTVVHLLQGWSFCVASSACVVCEISKYAHELWKNGKNPNIKIGENRGFCKTTQMLCII